MEGRQEAERWGGSGGGGGGGERSGGMKVNRFFNSSAGNFSVFVNCLKSAGLKSAGAHCAGKQQSHYSMILIVDKELFLSKAITV